VDAVFCWQDRVDSYLRTCFGERGASLVEYALLVALIALVCIGAITLLGGHTNSQFSNIGSAVGS
jgi:pilus assembly protein Flp/PilA